MQYVELKHRPPDPNRAKFYAILLCLAAALIAIMTLKTNYSYFKQYYEGFDFWMRVIPFYAWEVSIVLLPLAIGWGNHWQRQAAKIFEVALVVVALVHTSLVGQADQAKKIAAATKTEAKADLNAAQKSANDVATQNQKLQDGYNRAMANWNRVAANARALGQAAPPPPVQPQLLTVPQINQSLVSNSTLSVEQAADAEVDHKILLRLLYFAIGLVIATIMTQVSLADSSRIMAWLKKKRADELSDTIRPTNLADTNEPPRTQPASRPISLAPPIGAPAQASSAQTNSGGNLGNP